MPIARPACRDGFRHGLFCMWRSRALLSGRLSSFARAQQDGPESARPGSDIDIFLAGAASDRIDVLLYYLEKGFDPDSRGKAGNTALIVAVWGRGRQRCQLPARSQGRSGYIANDEGWTPLMEAAFRDRSGDRRTGSLQAGADPNRTEQRNGYTALHVAARGADPVHCFGP